MRLSLILSICCISSVAFADVTTGVQVRPRMEKAFTGNIGATSGAPNYLTTQRTRANLGFGSEGVSGKLSIQDVRAWGSETGTLTDASGDMIDFHEAYIEMGSDTKLRVGRQEFSLDEGRILSNNDWQQQGRSFDGVSLSHKQGEHNLSLMAARVMDGSPHDVIVANARLRFGNITLSVPALIQTNMGIAGNQRGASTDDSMTTTVGAHVKGGGALSWRAEGYFQTGDDHSAYLASVKAGYNVSDMLSPALSVDIVSGDSDHTDAQTGSFSNPYGAVHQYHGAMDMFSDVGSATGNGGLMDIALSNKMKGIAGGDISVSAHYFMLAGENAAGTTGAIGSEVDVVYSRSLAKGVNLDVGGGVFMDMGDYADVKASNIHDWVYVGLDMAI
ncbi:MAG: hypothetical protein CMH60_01605 [Myxococcales bacterium]|nr:hypothetical protein [Myxococcales bacterium]